jgi:starch-binding outer membrane protein, SusD/RagB family
MTTVKSERTRPGAFGVMPALTVAAVLLLGAGCDLSVTNPGPVPDDFLNNPAAHPAVVNGMGRDLSVAMNFIALNTASITREVHPAGSQGAFGILLPMQQGLLPIDHSQTNSNWNLAQRARWVAESGIRRLEEAIGAGANQSPLMAQAHLWAGYANRLLGENMCEGIIDSGPREPHTVYLQRAEAHFSQAATIGTAAGLSDVPVAAVAGRAAVRVNMGNWAGAVQDAGQIPSDFVYEMPYFAVDLDQYNRVNWSSANQPFRAHTTWNTVYEEYYQDTGDPRTAWDQDPDFPVGDANVLDLGAVPWYFQLKHPTRTSPVNLSSGREMRLIEAEALLRDGEWADAMTLVNGLRADYGLDPWPASGLDEAWTRYKRERGIELWLEARRMGDMRRWEADGVPGELHPLEYAPESNLSANRVLCYPIPLSEIETNPNL